MRAIVSLVLALGLTGTAVAAEEPLTVERLAGDGWEIAGYVGTVDNRSSLILFRNRAKPYLVQCSILHDVTRNPRVVTNCYELH